MTNVEKLRNAAQTAQDIASMALYRSDGRTTITSELARMIVAQCEAVAADLESEAKAREAARAAKADIDVAGATEVLDGLSAEQIGRTQGQEVAEKVCDMIRREVASLVDSEISRAQAELSEKMNADLSMAFRDGAAKAGSQSGAWRNPAQPPRDGVHVEIFTEGGISVGWWNGYSRAWHNSTRPAGAGIVDAWRELPGVPMPHEMPWLIEGRTTRCRVRGE